MFDRKYAARDRRKSRGLISKLHMADVAEYKTRRTEPLPDEGFDPVDLGMIDDHLDEYYRRTITPEQWRAYTTPQPFTAHSAEPTHGGKKMKDPTTPWRGFMAALKDTAKDLRKRGKKQEAKAFASKWLKDGPMPAAPTFEEQVAKAGGRIVRI